MKRNNSKNGQHRKRTATRIISAVVMLALTMIQAAMAQDGNAGINQATSQVKSYFDTGTNLMYAIGAIVGLVGAIKVFKKWTSEERARFVCGTNVHLANCKKTAV